MRREVHPSAWSGTWPRASRRRKSAVEGKSAVVIQRWTHKRAIAQSLGFADEAVALGRKLEVWARAAEIQALAEKGLKHDNKDAARFSGRAKPLSVHWKPVRVPNKWGTERPDGGGAREVAMLWATCRAMAAKVAVAVRGGHRGVSLGLKAKLLKMMARGDGAVPRAWDAVQFPQDAAAAIFVVMNLCRMDADQASAETALRTLTRLEERQFARDLGRARERWKKWVASAIKDGAGAAHKWCNAPNAVRYTPDCGFHGRVGAGTYIPVEAALEGGRRARRHASGRSGEGS